MVFAQGFFTHDCVARKPVVFLVVCGKMLRCGNGFQVVGILPLQTAHESCAVLSRKERIFPVGLRGSTPARVARKVQIGRPECEQTVIPSLSVPKVVSIHGTVKVRRTGFRRNGIGDCFQKSVVKHRAQRDRLREHRKVSRTNDAVQRLIAVIILRNAETLDCFGCFNDDIELFLCGHPAYERFCTCTDFWRSFHNNNPF